MLSCITLQNSSYYWLIMAGLLFLGGCTLSPAPSYHYEETGMEITENYGETQRKSQEQEEAEKYCFEWSQTIIEETCALCQGQLPTCGVACRFIAIQALPALCEKEGVCIATVSDFKEKEQCTIDTEEHLKRMIWGSETGKF